MLIHVLPRARLKSLTGELTYQTAEAVTVGQLVLVSVRGRSVPGIVTKIKVEAGTTARILPVKQIGEAVVPASWVKTIQLISEYYAWPPAAVLSQMSPWLNRTYLRANQTVAEDRQLKNDQLRLSATVGQKCYLTPSTNTPFAQSLKDKCQSLPRAAANQSVSAGRRELWAAARAGQPLSVLGTTGALLLPYSNLEEIILDAPLASPYRNERAPGLHTAVLACLVAQATGAQLTIRSALTVKQLQSWLPLPPKTRIIQPKLNPITSLPLKGRGYLNPDLIAELKERLDKNQRLLIYFNHLPQTDRNTGKIRGLEQLALELAKKLERPVGAATASTRKNLLRQPVVVATSTALYDPLGAFEHTFILSLEGLISPDQPRSPLSAVETVATLASRNPLTVQYQDSEHWLTAACRQQLSPAALTAHPVPTFSFRIITAKSSLTDQKKAFMTEFFRRWPSTIINEKENRRTITALVDRVLSVDDRQFIGSAPAGWKLFTDDDSLPSAVE